MEIKLDGKYRTILREALSDYQYKISLELNKMKGQALTSHRKELTKKQRLVEELRSQLAAE